MKLRQHRKKHQVEGTIALINIVFLMLIFFLVAGTIAVPLGTDVTPPELQALPLEMPEADVLQVTKDGALFWAGREMALGALTASFQDLGRRQLKIMADRDFSALKLVVLLDHFRNSGVIDIKLITLKGRGAD